MLHVVLNRTECSQALRAPFPSGQHEGQEHQQWHSLPDYVGLGPPGEWVCYVCLVYKQGAGRWIKASHYQHSDHGKFTQVFPQKVKSVGPHGWHMSPGWMGWLCAQTLRAAVWAVGGDGEPSGNFQVGFSSACMWFTFGSSWAVRFRFRVTFTSACSL